MGKKYIIEIDDGKNIIRNCGKTMLTVQMAIGKTAGSINTGIELTPYTEPDTSEAYQRGYDDAKHECQYCQKIMTDAEQERVDKAYQQGLEDARNRKATCEFCEYTGNDVTDEPCVRCCCGYMNMFRPKKEDIQVGDEVRSIERGWTAIVTRLKEGYLTLMDNSGEIANGYVKNMFTKTGRHFPEIAEVLRKMKENDG